MSADMVDCVNKVLLERPFLCLSNSCFISFWGDDLLASQDWAMPWDMAAESRWPLLIDGCAGRFALPSPTKFQFFFRLLCYAGHSIRDGCDQDANKKLAVQMMLQ